MTVRKQHGKPAVTRYEVIESMDYFSLVRLTLGTGRTHQIRVHLNHINHPVFGDPEYNGRTSQLSRIPANRKEYVQSVLKRAQRQMLHAKELTFLHPADGMARKFTSSLPTDMSEVIKLVFKV
jgi:23S rRNA pseudouridine1911/1915/1917 synthase